jgi:Tfp pilus assembly protein PilE
MCCLPPIHGERSADRGLEQQAGFTIVEAMIALLLTSLVVGLVYSSFRFFSRAMSRWERRMALENTVHTVVRDLTRVAYRAVEIRRAEGRWSFVGRRGTTTYRHRATTLRRNGRAVNEPPVEVIGFSLALTQAGAAPGRTPSGRAGSTAFGGGADPGKTAPVRPSGRYLELHLRAATRADTLAIDTGVYLRQPEAWSAAPAESTAER